MATWSNQSESSTSWTRGSKPSATWTRDTRPGAAYAYDQATVTYDNAGYYYNAFETAASWSNQSKS